MKSFKHKHPAIFGVVVGIALASASAALAFFIYTGVTGSGSGNFATSTTAGALNVTTGAPSAPLDAGSTVNVPVTITNMDPSSAHTLTSDIGVTLSSSPASCANHLTSVWHSLGDGPVWQNGQPYGVGTALSAQLQVSADASTPNSCAGGTFTMTFAGNTTP